MRSCLPLILLAPVLGSCAFFSEEGFEPVRHNARLTATVTYIDDLDIEGPGGSTSSDIDEESYALAVEWEDAEGFAPYLEIGRGSWTFDWPVEVDLLRWSAGARWYGGYLGDEDSWFADTRPYGDLGLTIIDPDPFVDGAEAHRYSTGFTLNLGAGLQRDFREDWFFEVGAQLRFGFMDEIIKNLATNQSVENDWDWTQGMLILGIGRRF